MAPSQNPSVAPSMNPSVAPSQNPSQAPSMNPSVAPSQTPCKKKKRFIFFLIVSWKYARITKWKQKKTKKKQWHHHRIPVCHLRWIQVWHHHKHLVLHHLKTHVWNYAFCIFVFFLKGAHFFHFSFCKANQQKNKIKQMTKIFTAMAPSQNPSMTPSQNPSVSPSMNPSIAPSQTPCEKTLFFSFFFVCFLKTCFWDFMCLKYNKWNTNKSNGAISKSKCVTFDES